MSTTAAPVTSGFRMIPLTNIVPSPMNPRKRFEEKPLKELAESIKVHGVRQPILVRPDGKTNRFEIVVGERRFRASKLAGKTDIPAMVDQLSNSQALEIMVIENLQREDVHPFDEALGYEALLRKAAESDPELGELPGSPKHTVESIAAKVGKSVGYVYARLKLLALIPVARKAFEEDLITPGHAVLIARLQPIDQVRALDACFHSYGNDRELKKHDPEKVKLDDLRIDPMDSGLLPEKALREWIQDSVNLSLKDVPWDLADANLHPTAGPCTTCAKRSTSNPGLFADLAVKGADTCFDAKCFQEKRSYFVKIQLQTDKHLVKTAEKGGGEPREELLQLSEMSAYTKPKIDQAIYRRGQWLPAKQGSCINVRAGIMVRGEEQGQRKFVCIDQSCKVHKHSLESHATRDSGSGRKDDYEASRYKEHKEEIAEKKKARARAILCREIVKHIGIKFPVPFLREVAVNLTAEHYDLGQVSELLGEKKALSASDIEKRIEKADTAKLIPTLTAILLIRHLDGWNINDETSRATLRQLGQAAGIKDASKLLAAADKAIAEAPTCRGCGCTEDVPCQYWDGNKHVTCKWKEPDLCSNPKCAQFAPAVKTSAKAAGK